MTTQTFIGRKNEVKQLNDLYTQINKADIVVMKGRRRIGKSRLITEFAKNKLSFQFTGLAPIDGVTHINQLDHFGHQLAVAIGCPTLSFTNWSDAFIYLSNYLNIHHKNQKAIVLFDEISWMGSKDPTFIPKLKAWWDVFVASKMNVMLIFCGSISTWIEDNIINNTVFFGRISLTINLEPISLAECAQFLKTRGFYNSTIELFKLLAITGGIPWYLEQIKPNLTADQNIKELCFKKNGLLVNEFDRIFHDLFNGSGSNYKKILDILKQGARTLVELRNSLNYKPGGNCSAMLEHLITCGFVSKHAQWSLKTGMISKQNLYKIKDPYIRFYLKYIEPNRSRILNGYYDLLALNQIPGFSSQMGFQVESLLLQNRQLLLEAIGIHPADCLHDNPYKQNTTTRTKGCQIDYLIQTRTKSLYLCEFKFNSKELGSEIIAKVQEKMNKISIPRGFALIPILFHIGGVVDSVYSQQYFYKIIDISDFLEIP